MDKITYNIYSIFEEENRFLTLPELYKIYKCKFDVSEYKDYQAVIRRHIYSQCIDRDIRDQKKITLFYSLAPKKTIGNLYGIVKWISENIKEDIDEKDINESIDRLSIEPIFDEPSIIKYDQIREYTIVRINSRRIAYALNTIVKANYLCEVDNNHLSFIRKTNGKNYTEAHHLIPLRFQKDFLYNLDVPANIISLCSNCHNEIHYGIDSGKIIRKLFRQRKNGLTEAGIDITLDKLLNMYKLIDID